MLRDVKWEVLFCDVPRAMGGLLLFISTSVFMRILHCTASLYKRNEETKGINSARQACVTRISEGTRQKARRINCGSSIILIWVRVTTVWRHSTKGTAAGGVHAPLIYSHARWGLPWDVYSIELCTLHRLTCQVRVTVRCAFDGVWWSLYILYLLACQAIL